METTTVELDDETYHCLMGAQREEESIGDVVLRLTETLNDDQRIAVFAGGLSEDFATAVEESSMAVRASLSMETGTEER